MIKNKTKLGLAVLGIIAVVVLLSGSTAALAANIVYGANTDVYLTGTGYTVTINSGSELTSAIVGTSTIIVVVPTSSTLTLTSRNDVTVTASGGTDASSTSCSGNTNTLVIPGDSAITYTLTPNGGICDSQSGGGGNYTPAAAPAAVVTPTPAATTTTTTTPTTTTTTTPTTTTTTTTTTPTLTLKALPYATATTTVEMQANLAVMIENLATLQAMLKTVTDASATGTSVPSSGSYSVSMSVGSEGGDVTALQNFLKSQGTDIYPEGLVTGYYGSLTKAAVGRFQIKNGVVTSSSDAGYGRTGPKTRAKINSLLGL